MLRSLHRRSFSAIAVAIGSLFAVCEAIANETTWIGNGGNDDWSTSGNWTSNTVPDGGSGDSIVHFAGSTGLTPNNDYSAFTQFKQILFDSGASSFTLNGNVIKLFSGDATPAKIENNSSNLQIINFNPSGDSILTESAIELNPTQGDLTINGGVKGDFNDGTINVFGNNGHVLTFNGEIGQYNTTTSIVNQANNIIVFNAANTYTGNTTIKAGEVRFGQSGSSNSSTILLGDTAGSASATVTMLGSTQSLSSAITVQSGSSGEAILKSQNTTGTTNNWTGTITLNKSLTFAATNSGAIFAVNTVIASSAQTVSIGSTSMANNGTVRFDGSADNVNIAATVNSGTLLLNKTSSGSVHALGAGLTVNAGGTVALGGSGGDQIFDSMAMTLNGGRFNTSGLSEGSAGSAGIGALTLQSSSIIDMGSVSSILAFANSSGQTWSGTISIYNWSGDKDAGNGTDQLYFGTTSGGLTSTQLSEFQFYSDAGITAFSAGAVILSTGEVVAVPEPGGWAGAVLAFGALAFTQRRRRLARSLRDSRS